MDWNKYTGKKLTASFPVKPIIPTKLAVWDDCDDKSFLTLNADIPGLARDVFGIERNAYPSFDEVWESIQTAVKAELYGKRCVGLEGAIEMFSKIAMRVMYEALTKDRP